MAIVNEITKLRESCEAIDNSQPVQIPAAMAPGDMLPQGDIGLLMLEKAPQGGTVNWESGDFQLAPGNTKGSRHTIPEQYRHCVTIVRISDGDPLSDLGLIATEPFDLEHPEHADHIGYPVGYYRVRHQQNSQRERVLD